MKNILVLLLIILSVTISAKEVYTHKLYPITGSIAIVEKLDQNNSSFDAHGKTFIDLTQDIITFYGVIVLETSSFKGTPIVRIKLSKMGSVNSNEGWIEEDVFLEHLQRISYQNIAGFDPPQASLVSLYRKIPGTSFNEKETNAKNFSDKIAVKEVKLYFLRCALYKIGRALCEKSAPYQKKNFLASHFYWRKYIKQHSIFLASFEDTLKNKIFTRYKVLEDELRFRIRYYIGLTEARNPLKGPILSEIFCVWKGQLPYSFKNHCKEDSYLYDEPPHQNLTFFDVCSYKEISVFWKEFYEDIPGNTPKAKSENGFTTLEMKASAEMRLYKQNQEFYMVSEELYSSLKKEQKVLFLKAHRAWNKHLKALSWALYGGFYGGSYSTLYHRITRLQEQSLRMNLYKGLKDSRKISKGTTILLEKVDCYLGNLPEYYGNDYFDSKKLYKESSEAPRIISDIISNISPYYMCDYEGVNAYIYKSEDLGIYKYINKEQVPDLPEINPLGCDFITHTIIEGNTIENISNLYGIDIEAILCINDFYEENIELFLGEKIKIPIVDE